MNKTKNNHYVPKFYLKMFLNQDDEIYKCDLKNQKIYKISDLKSECSKKNLYTVKTKITIEELSFFRELFLKELPISEEFLYHLVKYLNDELADLFYIEIPTNKEVEIIANNHKNKINNPNLSRTQEELFTYVYENDFRNVYNKIIKEKKISFLNQDLSDNFIIYSWEKITRLVYKQLSLKMINYYQEVDWKNKEKILKISDMEKPNSFYDLLMFIFIQFVRTENIFNNIISAFSSNKDGFEKYNLSHLNFENLYFLFLHIQPTFITNSLLMEGFKIILIENISNKDFIVSDNPCFNIYATFIEGLSLQKDDFELYFPLSSKLALLFTNRNCYKKLQDSKILLNKEKDVDMYNQAVRLQANRYIYGNNEALIQAYI